MRLNFYRCLFAWLIFTGAPSIPTMALATILVVGHQNPDTDAIASAIAVAHLKTALGSPAQARAQGKPNAETRFVLKRFGFNAPLIQHHYAGHDVILVDHSDEQLAPEDINKARIVGIYDHHKLGGIRSKEPLEIVTKPWGSTATVLQEIFVQKNIPIPPPLAGLMLSAILSDTRTFVSPTTTPQDRLAARALADIAGIDDMNALGQQMLQAYNEEMQQLDEATLVGLDMKIFNMGSFKIGVTQIETLDASMLTPRLPLLQKEILKFQKTQNLDGVVMAITDLQRGGSTLFAVGPQAGRIKKALKLDDPDAGTWKPDLFSRKRQLIPALELVFSE
jgi:manganese-dependent inorganic pyrophosphatase